MARRRSRPRPARPSRGALDTSEGVHCSRRRVPTNFPTSDFTPTPPLKSAHPRGRSESPHSYPRGGGWAGFGRPRPSSSSTSAPRGEAVTEGGARLGISEVRLPAAMAVSIVGYARCERTIHQDLRVLGDRTGPDRGKSGVVLQLRQSPYASGIPQAREHASEDLGARRVQKRQDGLDEWAKLAERASTAGRNYATRSALHRPVGAGDTDMHVQAKMWCCAKRT